MKNPLSIVIVLIAMNTIADRILTWFKLKFGSEEWLSPLFPQGNEDHAVKSDAPEFEKFIVKIPGLNIILGTAPAFGAKANFLDRSSLLEHYRGIGCTNFDSARSLRFSALPV